MSDLTELSSLLFEYLFNCPSFTIALSISANNRRGAGHAVTNILAKELLQEDAPRSAKKKTQLETEDRKESSPEDTGSLEDLLDDAPLRSN